MKKIRFLFLLVLVVSLNVLLANHLYSKNATKSNPKDLYKELDLFTDVLAIVQKSYVEETDSKELIYGSLKGMLGSLDPHSQFMDPDMYREMKVETEGEFGGLGIEITIKDRWLTVVTPMPGTPAFDEGLRPGDRIVRIDGESTEEITLLKAVKKLRGKPGSTVKLKIMRKGKGVLLDFTIERAIIKLDSIKDDKMVSDQIGYVRITQFQDHTSVDLRKKLDELKDQGMNALILDLRHNPGGLLSEAIDVSEIFIGAKLIVSQKGRLPEQNAEYMGHPGSAYLELPLVILVNGGSASGSEIVAGAIQDYGRGILLGTKTFGKGSVQSVLPMEDGSALRLTTAKYFTPKGRSVHGKGIVPDIVVEVSEEDEIKLMQAKRKEKLKKIDKKIIVEDGKKDKKKSEDKQETKDKVKEEDNVIKEDEDEKKVEVRDVQLDRAMDLLKGLHILLQKENLVLTPGKKK